MSYIPLQGDIIIINFDPRKGSEQKGSRPGVIVSNHEYHNKTNNLALVCPITNTISNFPMHVALNETTKTKGEIMCEQITCIDLKVRNAEYVESLPDDIIDNIIDLICACIE